MSFDDKEKENLLRKFFRERLALLDNKAVREDLFYSNEDKESFFVEKNIDANYVSEINFENLSEELKKMWEADFPTLAEMSDDLILLAEKIREQEKVSDEVSPFIYQMF